VTPTILTIELEYLNDITSKYLLRIIRALDKSCEDFTVKWNYEKDDDDMLELVQLMEASTGCKFKITEI
jgi:hypothetical protein